MGRITGLWAASAFVISAFGGLALAHSGATGVVKERMEAMKYIAAQMKQIGVMVKGEQAYSADVAAAAAAVIAEHAETMPSLFPEGSNSMPSEALATIWSDWGRFARSAEELSITATTLSEVAGSATSADEIRVQFAAVGKTCSACHEGFRKAN
ncbi:c-type cytochrome [Hoeflea prorocentri]|uniref:Cytochrome c n=1 Tax=Hoeflea prorocentri TaxID=1922333 RepID=A0A9X3UMJ8_9HYPH|nr:cytochrome c [Hoeflea prorocentri]MCY6383364.1 cytochrome c [Hoeflea prorocentri]MDA5401164.1 cytochrome c [Hoeflea prorocentri]